MRSLLFVPADSPRKLERAMRSGADCLIVDLEDSIAASNKAAARRAALSFLREHQTEPGRPILYVRINALDTPFSESDLDEVMTSAPDGIMLPKARGGTDVSLLSSRLAVREALHGATDGATRIIPLASESAAAVFTLGTYAGSSTRLAGLTWGAEDLSADSGALAVRVGGDWTDAFRLVRNLSLFAAAAAGVAAIDTVFTDFRDAGGLARECELAARDGFSGKLAIHPDQVDIINDAFTPAPEAIAHAENVVTAFANSGNAGVTSLEGKMLDRPHLKAAKRLLARARQARS